VDETGAVEKVGVVVNEVRRVPKEASKVSRDATTSLSISLIEFMGHLTDLGGKVVAFRRQSRVRQLKDTWPKGFLYL
jgi:hypothetical protein